MTTAATELDGRRARRGRNREAVVDALLDLFREGDLSPSVAKVAERSGVSLRSVFRYFDDLDEMGRIAIARHSESVRHLFPLPGIGEGDRGQRIRRFVDHRIALYREVAPVVRATVVRAPFQPVVAEGIARRRAYLRSQIDEHFAPEFAALPDADQETVGAAVEVATSFESLELLRSGRRMSHARCAAVMRASLERLLPG